MLARAVEFIAAAGNSIAHEGQHSHANVASRAFGDFDHFVVERGGRICEGLSNILGLKLWVLAQELLAIGIDRERLEDATHRKSQIANARLAIHPIRIHRDASERSHGEYLASRSLSCSRER